MGGNGVEGLSLVSAIVTSSIFFVGSISNHGSSNLTVRGLLAMWYVERELDARVSPRLGLMKPSLPLPLKRAGTQMQTSACAGW